MKPRRSFFIARRPSPVSAFTMIEIALSLAVIGITIVSIIGILPRAMDVQKNNRRETIINQDANYFIEAIRGGARGLDDLTNYVLAITNYWTKYNSLGGATGSGNDRYDYNMSAITSLTPAPPPNSYRLTTGQRVVGLLTTPKFLYFNVPPNFGLPARQSNYVVAYFRAISGAATEKFPQTNAAVQEAAFGYRLVVELMPYTATTTNGGYFNSSWTNFLALTSQNPGLQTQASNAVNNWVRALATNGNPNLAIYLTNTTLATNSEFLARANYWLTTRQMTPNLYDLRLLFRWPLLPGNRLGNGRQNYRAMVSSALTNDPVAGPLYFARPNNYVKIP